MLVLTQHFTGYIAQSPTHCSPFASSFPNMHAHMLTHVHTCTFASTTFPLNLALAVTLGTDLYGSHPPCSLASCRVWLVGDTGRGQEGGTRERCIYFPPSLLPGRDLGSYCVPTPTATAHIRRPVFQGCSSSLVLVKHPPPLALASPEKVSP